MPRPFQLLWVAATLLPLCGCHTPPACDKNSVSEAIESRFSHSVPETKTSSQLLVPPALANGEPLDEEHAVLLALWNNALFRELLLELDLTQADLVQAGLLPNPEFLYYWGEPAKPFRYLFDFPLEALYLRPIRIKVMAAENERACAKLTQTALDLIRDSRQAFADLQMAHDMVKVGERAMALRNRILELAEARLKNGDATPLEVSTARIDALLAAQDLTRLRYEVTVMEERVRNFLGLSATTFPLVPDNTIIETHDAPVEELVNLAVHSRPDLLAAERAAAAATARLSFARLGWFRFLGIGDATTGTITDHAFGPALRFTVPIFNRNQGGIARAKAEFEQLDRRRQTVENQIILDVRQSHARFQQTAAELEYLRKKTRPEVEAAIRRAEIAYKEGNVTYVIVLEMNRQLIDTYAREALLYANLRRAWAELERSVGKRLK
jgi:cobalt-zinc-cadmium efflux system outer membrane protein